MSKIKQLLDARYDKRRQLLHGTVTATPMVAGRSAGYVVAKVAGIAGVRVNVSADQRTPLVVGDGVMVEGIGTPAATSYWLTGRISGARPASDVFVFPSATDTENTSYEAGDILLGSTLADWSNWWYQFAQGRWIMRRGTVMQGAIGDMNGLYDYDTVTFGSAFGEYAPGEIWIATDAYNGFRIMDYAARTFQVEPDGAAHFGRADAAEITITPDGQQITFGVDGVIQSAIDAEGRTIYGFERLGRPLGPAIEWSVISAIDGEETDERWGFWLRNKEGERFFALISGTETNPEDASLRLGVQGGTNYLQMQNGKLSWAADNTSLNEAGVFTATDAIIEGTITANSGTIGGFTIGDDRLVSTNTRLRLVGLEYAVENAEYGTITHGEGIELEIGSSFDDSGLRWYDSDGIPTANITTFTISGYINQYMGVYNSGRMILAARYEGFIQTPERNIESTIIIDGGSGDIILASQENLDSAAHWLHSDMANRTLYIGRSEDSFDFASVIENGLTVNGNVALCVTAGGTLGFHGATPITQAVLATGAGASVDNVITALQNLGLVKQS